MQHVSSYSNCLDVGSCASGLHSCGDVAGIRALMHFDMGGACFVKHNSLYRFGEPLHFVLYHVSAEAERQNSPRIGVAMPLQACRSRRFNPHERAQDRPK